MPREKIILKTSDKKAIAADFYPVAGARKGILLLHMMPRDRTSWIPFAEKLQREGFQALAIDFRGHGESEGGPQGYEHFTDEEHQSSYRDIEAADLFLREKGVTSPDLIGASIGANLALWYLVDHPELKKAVLLSAGINYRGIETFPLARRVGNTQSVYFAGSLEDERSSGKSAGDAAKELFSACTGKKELKLFDGAGHGTIMLERNPSFLNELMEWLRTDV